MEFCKIEDIKDVVNTKAKYQKVLLVYDDTVSSLSLLKIYEQVKEICVFNKMYINDIDMSEINNGYKILIFCCSANNYLKANLNVKEFTNIFIPTDNYILPFFVQDNILSNQANFLILKGPELDMNIFVSCFFNKFYNYLKKLLTNLEINPDFDFEIKNINQKKLIDLLLQSDFEFEDLKIIKKCKLDLYCLPIVDYLLLFAFLFLFQAVHNQNLMMVDIYKVMKEDYANLDKFFALANNAAIIQILNINYLELASNTNNILKTIDRFLPFNEQFKFLNNEILEKIKNYAKNENSLLNFLYLFKIFGE